MEVAQSADVTKSPDLGFRDPLTSIEISQSVFEDPKDFLQILRSGYGDLDRNKSGGITPDELELYKDTGTKPELMAAAEIALDHYNDINNMRDSMPDLATRPMIQFFKPEGLTEDELRLAHDIAENKPDSYMATLKSNLPWQLGLRGITAGFFGGAAFFSSPSVLGTVGFGTASVFHIGMLGAEATLYVTGDNDIRNGFNTERTKMDAWREFQ